MSRKFPNRLFEGDLVIAAVGLLIVIVGSAITAGALKATGPYPATPEPVLGKVIVVVGLAIVLLGLSLALANVVLYFSAKRRDRRQHQ